MRRVCLTLALASAACTGTIGGSESSVEVNSCAPTGRNDEIRLKLQKACAGCHTIGNKPFFASLEAFENGLVYNPAYIVAGDPENSLFIQMIKGTAAGSYPQMPPGEPYSAQLADGRATLSIEALETWVKELPPPPARLEEPSPEAFTVRRLTAEEMVQSLMDQLGLDVADFVYTGSGPDWRATAWMPSYGALFVWPPDWAPGISGVYGSDTFSTERFETLGGPATLYYRKRDVELGPSALQTLVQVSQAWCRRAIEKPGNKAVLKHVTLADQSATNAAAIKQNLRALYLRMLAQPATDDEIEQLYTQLYLPYEATSTKAAWTAVCASFVRHPLWLTF